MAPDERLAPHKRSRGIPALAFGLAFLFAASGVRAASVDVYFATTRAGISADEAARALAAGVPLLTRPAALATDYLAITRREVLDTNLDELTEPSFQHRLVVG